MDIKTIKAASYFSVSQILTGISNLYIHVIYAKNLPAAGYGQISLLSMCFLLGTLIIDSRLTTAYSVRHQKGLLEKSHQVLGAIAWYYIIVSLSVLIICWTGFFDIVLKFDVDPKAWFFLCTCMFLCCFSNLLTNVLILEQRGREYFEIKAVWNAFFVLQS